VFGHLERDTRSAAVETTRGALLHLRVSLRLRLGLRSARGLRGGVGRCVAPERPHPGRRSWRPPTRSCASTRA